MAKPTYNLLVSFERGFRGPARSEIQEILKVLGDESPLIEDTIAEGILGVNTSLDAHKLIGQLRKLYMEDPNRFVYTLKWRPIDFWTRSEIDDIKACIERIKDRIVGSWRMTVEKRRFTKYHKIDLIRAVAPLIENKVDLENYDTMLLVEIIGGWAGIAILKRNEIFSIFKAYEE